MQQRARKRERGEREGDEGGIERTQESFDEGDSFPCTTPIQILNEC